MVLDTPPGQDGPPTPFSATTHRDGDHVTITISGELDLTTGPEVDAASRDLSGARTVTVDLSQMRFIDSSGILALLNLDERARSAGCELTLANPTPWVSKLIELLDLRQRIKVREATTVDD